MSQPPRIKDLRAIALATRDDNYKKVEGESDLVRDMNSIIIINRNKSTMKWF